MSPTRSVASNTVRSVHTSAHADRAGERELAGREHEGVVDVEQLAQAEERRVERRLGGVAVGVRPQRRHQLLAVDVAAVLRDQELQEVEGTLLRLAGEAHRHAVANELEAAERPDPQPERPRRRGVGGCREEVALDQHRHELRFDAVQEREIGEARGEIRPVAQEHDLAASPVFREHDGETVGGALHSPGVDIFLDQHELALLQERLAIDAGGRCDRLVHRPHAAARDRPR